MIRIVLLLCLLLSAGIRSWSQDSLRVQPVAKPVWPVLTSAGTKAITPLPAPGPVRYDYYNSLGAACKAELKLEKATRVPLRIRLGSLAQTDYLEQKPHAARPERP